VAEKRANKGSKTAPKKPAKSKSPAASTTIPAKSVKAESTPSTSKIGKPESPIKKVRNRVTHLSVPSM